MKKFACLFLTLCMFVLASCAGETQTELPDFDPSEVTLPDVKEQEETISESTESETLAPETAVPETQPASSTESETTIEPETTKVPETTIVPETTMDPETANSDEIDPDFKAMMDSYEVFFEEYCAFMKKYMENPYDMSLLKDYTNYLSKYADMIQKLEAVEDTEMSTAELKYYLEVYGRITEMLLDVL